MIISYLFFIQSQIFRLGKHSSLLRNPGCVINKRLVSQALFSNNLWIVGHQRCEKCSDKSGHDVQYMRWRCRCFSMCRIFFFCCVVFDGVFGIRIVSFTTSGSGNLSDFVDGCILVLIIVVALAEKSIVVQVEYDAKSRSECKSAKVYSWKD